MTRERRRRRWRGRIHLTPRGTPSGTPQQPGGPVEPVADQLAQVGLLDAVGPLRITSYNVCYTKLLRTVLVSLTLKYNFPNLKDVFRNLLVTLSLLLVHLR